MLRQRLRLLITVTVSGSPVLLWDLAATHAGHWWFDGAQTLPWSAGGLPLEEIAFFVVIPLVSVLTYEAVKVVRHGHRASSVRQRREVR